MYNAKVLALGKEWLGVPNAVRRLGKDRGIPFLKMILEDAFDIGCQESTTDFAFHADCTFI